MEKEFKAPVTNCPLKEFNLSEKKQYTFEQIDKLRYNDSIEWFLKKDVKEFIKKIEKHLFLNDWQIGMLHKLAGNELNGI